MTHVLIRHRVEDFDKWKSVYDSLESERVNIGSKTANVFRDQNDPSAVTVLTEWDSAESAEKFNSSDALKDAMSTAGVQGPPEIKFLDNA